MSSGIVGGAVAVRKVAHTHERKVITVACSVAFIMGDGIFFFFFFWGGFFGCGAGAVGGLGRRWKNVVVGLGMCGSIQLTNEKGERVSERYFILVEMHQK